MAYSKISVKETTKDLRRSRDTLIDKIEETKIQYFYFIRSVKGDEDIEAIRLANTVRQTEYVQKHKTDINHENSKKQTIL